MAWEIRRRNENKDVNQTAGKTYATGELAFRAAMRNATDYIAAHWNTAAGNNIDGPGDDGRFKLYIERRPGLAELELRWGYHTSQSVGETNSIFWRIVEV